MRTEFQNFEDKATVKRPVTQRCLKYNKRTLKMIHWMSDNGIEMCFFFSLCGVLHILRDESDSVMMYDFLNDLLHVIYW